MTFVSADRVRETSATTGTGTYNLAGAVSGFRTFVAGIGSANTCHYLATLGSDWELGLGTVTDAAPDTLARTRIFKSSNGDAAVSWGAGDKTITCVPIAAAIRDVVTPKGYIFDLTLANNGTDANNDIDIGAGEAVDEAGEVLMVLSGTITKRLDAAWVVGTNQGGLNTGAEAASTWYEVLLIYRQDTGVVDVMFSTTANRDTLPTNYTHKRRIGWIRNDGSSNILAFQQTGDFFTLKTPINDVAITKTTTATSVTLTVPPNTIARFRATIDGNTTVNANSAVIFYEITGTDVAPSLAAGAGSLGYMDLATCADAGHFELRANGSSQIRHDSEVAQANLDISTYGWVDRRRRVEPI